MTDLRQDQRWPDLVEAARRCRSARERVLAVWPEGMTPAELPPALQLELEQAETAVVEVDHAYRDLLTCMTRDLDGPAR